MGIFSDIRRALRPAEPRSWDQVVEDFATLEPYADKFLSHADMRFWYNGRVCEIQMKRGDDDLRGTGPTPFAAIQALARKLPTETVGDALELLRHHSKKA